MLFTFRLSLIYVCFRYVKKQKMASDGEQVRMIPNYAVRRVFKDDEENMLAEYLLKLSKMCYGLSSE